MVKRSFDFLFSLIGLIILSPFFLIVAVLVKVDSQGPILYVQQRVGRAGKLFGLFKFRTMHIDADKLTAITVGNRDPRITRAGYYLRKYKLDELPQLINVLTGDMSLVGPRPELKKFVDLYTDQQREVISVRPGITDLASIKFRNENEMLEGKPDPIDFYIREIMPVKLELNRQYIQTQSLLLDLKIIFNTLFSIFKKGAPVKTSVYPSQPEKGRDEANKKKVFRDAQEHGMVYQQYFKRFLDIVVSVLVLLATSWIFLLLILLYLITFNLPVFFLQERIGKNSIPFRMVKFRTLKVSEEVDRRFALGNALRFLSLDELPQLLNVLKGEMSMIGPRPLPMEYLSLFSIEQQKRHEVRPGITGWAQVNGRNSVSWEEKFKLDSMYVRNISFLFDVKIVVKTILVLLSFRKDTSLSEKKFTGSHGA